MRVCRRELSGTTMTNKELLDLLSKFPKDAEVCIEYCAPEITYIEGENLIEID